MDKYQILVNGKSIDEDDEEDFEFNNIYANPFRNAPPPPEPDCFTGEDAEGIPAKNGRVCVVKTYVTLTELDLIKKAAGHTAVSTWARNQLLRGTRQRYPVEIRTGDLDDLRRLLSDYNLHANGFLGGLRFRSNLYQIDIDHMTKLMDELNKQVLEAVRVVHSDRKYEKKKTEREIKVRLERIEEQHKASLEASSGEYGAGREGRRK